MQLTKDNIDSMRRRLVAVRERGRKYFAQADPDHVVEVTFLPFHKDWEIRDEEALQVGEALRQTIKELSIDIAGAARASPLLADADMQELRHNTRQMLANVHFREYHHRGVYVHHDEGTVLGADPPTHEEIPFEDTSLAARRFDQTVAKTLDLIDLLLPTDATEQVQPGTANYRLNTAFVMMAIDDSKPELEDTRTGIKEVFNEFGIKAITANEIEHEEAITDRILSEIETSEFLIADLTHERPNVYYEIGHAHVLNKRVILVRKKGAKIHFDVAHRNCLKYENVTDLKKLLRKRLESMTNKKNPAGIQ